MAISFDIQIPEWYLDYVNTVGERNYMDIMAENHTAVPSMLSKLSDVKWNHAYASGKWTIKELVMHMMDAERIFSYRALRFSRNDKTELSAFDENEYVPFYNPGSRSPLSIIEEYKAVRGSTLALFRNLDALMMNRTGVANNCEFSVDMIGFIIVGHELHHLNVLKERYGVAG